MKLIHTADWHLGKRLGGFALVEEQREALEKILDLVDRERPDAVVVAGDVFDTPIPPLSALECWEWFVANLVAEREVPLVVIPGNHDHPERLGINASITRLSGLYILNDLATAHVPVVIAGIEVFGVPFHKPPHVRAMLAREAAGETLALNVDMGTPLQGAPGTEPDHDHRIPDGSIVTEASDDDYDSAMRRMLARVHAARSGRAPAVLVGHAFIDGSGEEPDGEDAILVDA